MDGDYETTLAPIAARIRAIEKSHGLGPDEYWLRGEGPSEHVQLNKRYEAYLDGEFHRALSEFGAHDLARLWKRDRGEFERLRTRGARALMRRDDFVRALRDAVRSSEKDAHLAAKAGIYSAAVTLLGAGLEGVLLLRCLKSRTKAVRIAQRLPKKVRDESLDPTVWRFDTLIEVCRSARWLPRVPLGQHFYDTANSAHLVRSMRNSVHPAKQAKQRPWVRVEERDYRDAAAIYSVLMSSLRN